MKFVGSYLEDISSLPEVKNAKIVRYEGKVEGDRLLVVKECEKDGFLTLTVASVKTQPEGAQRN